MVERPTRGLVWLGWVHVLRVERHGGVGAEKNRVLSKGITMVSNQLWINEAKLRYRKKSSVAFEGEPGNFTTCAKKVVSKERKLWDRDWVIPNG